MTRSNNFLPHRLQAHGRCRHWPIRHLCVAGLLALAWGAAVAQQTVATASAADAATPSSDTLEEIVVTGSSA